MLLSLCAASVGAAIMNCRKKRRKNRKTWTREWLKNRTSFGAYYTLLAELRNHVFWSRVGLSTHINTFSKFHSNTAAVSVAMLDLSTKPRDTKLENDWWTSFNKRQLVERIDSSSILFNNLQLAYFNIQQYMFNISWVQMLNRVSLA